MRDYTTYSVEDFVTSESYLRYYYRENEEDLRFWSNWISRNPEKLDVIISADNYIAALSIRLSDAEFQIEQQRLADVVNETLEDSSPLYMADDEDKFFEMSSKRYKVAFQKRAGFKKLIAIVIVLTLLSGTYFLLS